MNHGEIKMSRTFSNKNPDATNDSTSTISNKRRRSNRFKKTAEISHKNKSYQKNKIKNENKKGIPSEKISNKTSYNCSHNFKSKSNGNSKFKVMTDFTIYCLLNLLKIIFYSEIFVILTIVALNITNVGKKATFVCEECGYINTVQINPFNSFLFEKGTQVDTSKNPK